jgi:hypothetical protein
MNPVRRWIVTHKVAAAVIALSVVVIIGAVAYSLVSARLEQQRIEDLLLSCDAKRANVIPQAQLGRFIAEWSACENTDARIWAVREAGEPEAAMLADLATDESPEVRLAVIANPATPSSVHETLATDPDASVRLALARAQFQLDQLVSDPSPEVRAAVAQAPSLSEDAMKQLSQDSDPTVKKLLLSRGDLSRGALLALARDGDSQICAGLPIAVMEQVAEEAEANDVWASDMLLAASRCPDDTMRRYAAREATGSAASLLLDLAADASESVRVAVAGNAASTWESLSPLSSDKSPTVRAAVAGNDNATPESLSQLVSDPDSQVRLAVLRNPNTPEGTLDLLASDDDYGVRLALAKNMRVSPNSLEILSSDTEVAIRQAVAQNDQAPASALARLARDAKTAIQAAVARNPGATTEVLLILCTSTNFNVYLKAKNRLDDEYYTQCLMSANSF